MSEVSELDKVVQPDIMVKLGGQERRLVFGMKAAKVFQTEYGSLTKAMDKMAEMGRSGLDVFGVESILFALLSIDKSITRENVSDWIEGIEKISDAREIFEAIAQAILTGSPVASTDPTPPTKK